MIGYAVDHLNPRYLLKCDDDTFVRLEKILAELDVMRVEDDDDEDGSLLYWGFFDGRAPIINKVIITGGIIL
jgi:hypothetical protein